jgi:hypothetical protein
MDDLLSIFNIKALDIVRVLILTAEIFYAIFSFVLYRQQRLMAETVIITTSSLLHLLTLVNLYGIIAIFVISVTLLI